MTAEELLQKILEKTKSDIGAYRDLYHVCCDYLMTEEHEAGLKYLRVLNEILMKMIPGTQDMRKLKVLFDLHRDVVKKAAPWDFDCYLLFLEWNRDPKKKFYVPRRKQLMPITRALQGLADDDYDLVTVSLPPGVGKLLSDDTPVLTRRGWKTHGELVVGDEVVGLDGEWKRVLHVFPKDVARYAVRFSNGEVVKCHENHEWVVRDRHKTTVGEYSTVTVGEMLRRGVRTSDERKRGCRSYYMLPKCAPMKGAEMEYAVDPYALGVWLGDGSASKPCVTLCDTDACILDEMCKGGYVARNAYPQVGCVVWELDRLQDDLRKYGMCYKGSKLKYIPEEYLRGSIEQRLALLAGLLDTDGTLSRESRYTFSNTNKMLIDSVCQLVSTFGWRYCLKSEEPKLSSSGIQGRKTVYSVAFAPDMDIPCVVERKRMTRHAVHRDISVDSITEIEPESGNCIQVEGGIYRVGHTMLPTHNSTMAIFFMCWLAGKNPDKPMLGGSHSNSFIRGVYDECLRVLDPKGEYLWHEVFPGVGISNTNAKECRIDLGKRKRFETLQFTSVNSANSGLYRAEQILFCDDLIDGIETAMSKDRLDKLWQQYTTDLRQRKIGDCKELHIATRWSLHDVIGRLDEMYGDSPRAKFLVFPAMDENDESNFDYPCDAGFSTSFYRQQREIMDDASWRALYMNQPIEREGQLYAPDELRRYFELPDGEPDGIFAVCDTKDRGSDYCVLPICYKYGNDWYIDDVICDNGKPEIVEERLIEILCRKKVHMARFESNSAGGKIAEKVQNGVKAKGGICKITTKYTTANKETAIIVASPQVKERCLFKDDSVIEHDREYRKFLELLCGYTMMGKNKHDDVPDAMGMLVRYVASMDANRIEIFQRPW